MRKPTLYKQQSNDCSHGELTAVGGVLDGCLCLDLQPYLNGGGVQGEVARRRGGVCNP